MLPYQCACLCMYVWFDGGQSEMHGVVRFVSRPPHASTQHHSHKPEHACKTHRVGVRVHEAVLEQLPQEGLLGNPGDAADLWF